MQTYVCMTYVYMSPYIMGLVTPVVRISLRLYEQLKTDVKIKFILFDILTISLECNINKYVISVT